MPARFDYKSYNSSWDIFSIGICVTYYHFGLIWPWPLTSWSPKLIVSCCCPADHLWQFASKSARPFSKYRTNYSLLTTVARNGHPAGFLSFTCERKTARAHVNHVIRVNVEFHVRTLSSTSNSTCARRHGWCAHVQFHVRTWSLKKVTGQNQTDVKTEY